MTAAGIYRAKVVAPFADGSCDVVIPQLFGDVMVNVSRFVGSTLPLSPAMGWVMFEGGDENNPVWMDTDTSVISADWYVTQAEADAQSALEAAALEAETAARIAAVASTMAGAQPLDADLTAIAALTTASFGRSLLTSADLAALQALIVPAAEIRMTAAATADAGWMMCDGTTVVNAQTLYPSFWARAPVAWRSGANIILPDMRGRAPIGSGTGAALTARTLGTAVSNEETHLLLSGESGVPVHLHGSGSLVNATEAAHTHSLGGSTSTESVSHTHGPNTGTLITSVGAPSTWNFGDAIGTGASYVLYATTTLLGTESANHTHPLSTGVANAGTAHGHTITGSTANNAAANAASAHNNMQPSYVVNFQIKVH